MRDLILNPIQSAFTEFNIMLGQIVTDLTLSPEKFNPQIWYLVTNIFNYIILPVSYSLLALFFIMDFLGKSTRLEFIRWENVVKPLLKLIVAKFVLENSYKLLNLIFAFVSDLIGRASLFGSTAIPDHDTQYIIEAIDGMNLIEKLAFMVNMLPYNFIMMFIKIAIFVVIYGRMVEIYLLTAIAPLPLATMTHDGLHHIAKSFLQRYFAVCLQGLIILLGVMIYGGLMQGLNIGGLRPNDMWGMLRNTILTSSILLMIVCKSGGWARQITGLGG
jgi:hypothetical protein